MIDYLAWRGDLTLEASPWNGIDAMLFATICYLSFNDTDNPRGRTLAEADREGLIRETDHSAFAVRRQVFEAMARSRRFGDVRMHHYIAITDAAAEMQFSATCYDLPDGRLCVGFRGTDATVIGWREDLNMSLLEPVPGQEAAACYLEKALALDGRPVRLTGHSKGGNLAMFAAAHQKAEAQERLEEIWSYDSPGMSPDVFGGEGYQRIAPKIHHFVPQTSIIGLLMEYPRPYRVVHSLNSGIQQHDILSWQVYGPRFEELEEVDENAVTIRDTLHEWLERSDRDQRAAFLDTAYRMVENTKATTISELTGEKMKTLRNMIGGSRDADPEGRKDFNKLMSLFLSLGVDNMFDRVRDKFADARNRDGEDRKAPGGVRRALEEALEERRAGKAQEKQEQQENQANRESKESPEKPENPESREEN